MKIGCIGQGFIGKNYADDFERRGYQVIRYALEEPYAQNGEAVSKCEIVFVAVPTPTTPEGFNDRQLRDALTKVGPNAIAVIKSTILPGTTSRLQQDFPTLLILHSPEFLREKSAAYDAANPERNILGIPEDTDVYHDAARKVLAVLPRAPYELVTDAITAELIKYGGNCFLFTKVVFMNLLYDLCQNVGADYEVLAQAMSADTRIGSSHMHPVDMSGHKSAVLGRGAGGHCFIKDFAALANYFEKHIDGKNSITLLRALEKKNIELLRDSGKDTDLLEGVYGTEILHP